MVKTVPQLANTMLSRYDAVLLDIDGTLVDSNGAHAAAWSDAFAAHDRHHSPEQVRPLIGKGGDKLLRELASLDDESREGKRIAEARVEIFRNRYLPTLKPTAGAVAFVEWLLERRLTVVVATSATEDAPGRACRQLKGFGTIISFDVHGDSAAAADVVCAGLQLIQHATSLGAVESTIERRASIPGQEHLPPTLLRLVLHCGLTGRVGYVDNARG